MSDVLKRRRAALARFSVEARYDPLLFAENAWDWGHGALANRDIRTWQAEVLDDIAQHLMNPDTRHLPLRVSISSGHGIGKSALWGMVSTWAMSCYRDPRIVITANTENQLRTKTSPEVAQWMRSSAYGDLFHIDTLKVALKEAPDQHRVDFTPWSETNPEAFQGLHAEGRIVVVIMDEASAIPPIIWETIIGALTDENTVLLWLVAGNPTQPVGAFRDTFRKHRHLWRNYVIDSRTVEGTNKAVLNQIIETYGEDSDVAKVRVRGLFPSQSSRQFIGEHLIDPAMGRHMHASQYDFAPVILTCDPAWTGDDELVIGKRQGLRFDLLEVLPRNDNDIEIGRKLAMYEVQHNADAVFIDFGYGTGIYSYGKTIGRDWRLIKFGDKASRPGFENKRCEMYDDMREWLEQGGAIPVDEKLREDLMGVQTKPRHDGVISLMSKEDMRKEGLPSPDRADALALSFAEPVVKRQRPITEEVAARSTGGHSAYREFDPHS